jgi:cyclopropane-fatty-acyl-phospholipid synthase
MIITHTLEHLHQNHAIKRVIGMDDARTLRAWCDRFMDCLEDIRRRRYTDEFIRMWQYYRGYCEGGFSEKNISNVQLVFNKPDCRLPVID